MKKIFKSLLCGFMVAAVLSFVPFEGQCREISEKVFRLHILANSDSDSDQSLKLKVRDAVLESSGELFESANSKEEAMELVKKNLPLLLDRAEAVIHSEGYDYKVTASVCQVPFDTRYYGDVTMPSGTYDALQIVIGEGKGQNWWCVMYPALCLGSATESEVLSDSLTTSQYSIVTSDGKYVLRFRALEIFNQITDKIRDLIK